MAYLRVIPRVQRMGASTPGPRPHALGGPAEPGGVAEASPMGSAWWWWLYPEPQTKNEDPPPTRLGGDNSQCHAFAGVPLAPHGVKGAPHPLGSALASNPTLTSNPTAGSWNQPGSMMMCRRKSRNFCRHGMLPMRTFFLSRRERKNKSKTNTFQVVQMLMGWKSVRSLKKLH